MCNSQSLQLLCFQDIALRIIGEFCSTSILFCGGPDQWAPLFHLKDLECLQGRSDVPKNIHSEYLDELRHDFVVHPEMIEPVAQFCIQSINRISLNSLEENDIILSTSKL
jgi:hypothetical protein